MLVSIIVPIYNAEKFLPRCIGSLLAQSYHDIEILLIVDDSSIDESKILCDQYAQTDARIKVYHQINVGVSVARNYGISQAQGTYLMFVDADDFVDTEIVEELIRVRQTENVELVVCTYMTYFFLGEQSSASGFKGISKGKITTDEYLDIRTLDVNEPRSVREKAHVVGNIWGRLYVSEIIKKNSLLFNTELNRYEDVLFNVSYMSYIKHFYILDKNLYNYCVYQGHISLSERVIKNKFFMIVLSYDAICHCYGSRQITYIKYFYSYLLIGHIVRLFQTNSPYSFWEAVSEVRTVCLSKTYKDVIVHYRTPKGASTLIPYLLKMRLFLFASIVAKLRMVRASLKKEPIRQWCFSPTTG